MQRTFTQLLTGILLLSAGMATAQAPFWTEDFDNGIPTGWTTTDGSSNGVLWEACSGTGPSPNCVDLYGQDPFASTTAANGFVVVDSDAAGDLPTNHISRLTTSAIDCSAASKVFAIFQNYVGVFAVPSTDNVVLKVSTDGTNWTSYNVVEGLDVNNRFSDNPHIAAINISVVAANKPVVYLQWEWTGNYEYWWMLDDVQLTTVDPTPANNLVLGDFFYPVSSYATPVSEIKTDTFGFYGYVSNKGIVDQKNVTLFAYVADDNNNILFVDSAKIDVLPVGYIDSLIVLPNRFAPELTTGLYSVVYAVSSDSTDARPNDNVDGDFFEVTDNLFSKERGPNSANQPAGGGNYAYANLYQMSSESLEKYRVLSFDIAAATNGAPAIQLEDISVTAYLFKVNDDVLPDFSNFDETLFFSSSLEWLGLGSFDFPDGAANFDIETASIEDVASGEAGVLLEKGARYFASIEYTDANNTAFHAVSDETSHFFLSSLAFNDASGWFAGFGADFNPVIRMNLDLVTSVDEQPLPETAMAVLPNPIQTTLNLQVGFDQATDATITLAEMSGRVINIDNRKGLTNELLTYQVPQLANGMYIVRMATTVGTRTLKFVVQK